MQAIKLLYYNIFVTISAVQAMMAGEGRGHVSTDRSVEGHASPPAQYTPQQAKVMLTQDVKMWPGIPVFEVVHAMGFIWKWADMI